MRLFPRRYSAVLVGCTALFLLAACRDFLTTTATPEAARSDAKAEENASIRRSRYYRPSEERFVQLAMADPAIAGFYFDQNGDVVIQVVSDTGLANAARLVSSLVSSDALKLPYRATMRRVTARKAEYTYQQLSDWRDAVTDSLLGKLGVVSDDLDESRNRVTIEIRGTSEGEVRAALRKMEIPDAAVIIEPRRVSSRKSMLSTPPTAHHPTGLGNSADTVGGGLLLSRTGHTCTLGFIASVSSNIRGVTASHCSTSFFGTDSTVQRIDGTPVMFESNDPAGTACGMFEGCDVKRYSDAALYTVYPATDTFVVGLIARPTERKYHENGSRNVDSAHPWLFITGVADPVMYAWADHIGYTTGWQYGQIDDTCSDMSDEGRKIICATRVGFRSGGGDSGGPVFVWDGRDGATLLGIDTAADCDDHCDFDDVSKFSAIGNIIGELGAMTVTYNVGISNLTNLTGSVSGTHPVVSWTASSTSGAPLVPTEYDVYREIWNQSTLTMTEPFHLVTSTTDVSHMGATFSGTPTYTGSTKPDSTVYSFARYYVRAYNSGIKPSIVGPIYFRAIDPL